MKKQRTALSPWVYFFVFTAIYFSMDTLQFGTNQSSIFSTILYVSAPALAVIAFLYGWKINSWISSKAFLAVFGVCIMVLCTHFTTESTLNMKYFFLCAVLLQAFFVSTVVSAEQFKKAFTDVVSVLALVSVCGFLLRYIFPGIVNYLPTITNIAGYKYGNLLLTVIPHDVMYVPFRNYGIFREPGVYQFYLNLALVFLLNEPKKAESWRFYSILLAMLFTFSTAGYILCAGVFAMYFFMGKLEIKVNTVVPVVIGGLVLLFLFAKGILRADGAVFSKLFTSNSSTNSRFGSIVVDFYLTLLKPVFGNGYEFVEDNFRMIARNTYGLKQMHNTNTVMKMLAVHGVFMPALFLTGVGLFCRRHMEKKSFPIFFILFIAMLSASDLIFNPVIYIIMFYGFRNYHNPVTCHERLAN